MAAAPWPFVFAANPLIRIATLAMPKLTGWGGFWTNRKGLEAGWSQPAKSAVASGGNRWRETAFPAAGPVVAEQEHA